MTIDNSGFKLLRKPRRPKLDKLDLTKVHHPDASDDEMFNSSFSESTSVLSSDRESSNYNTPKYNNKNTFPGLNVQKTQRDKLVVILEESTKSEFMPKNSLNTISSSSSSSFNSVTRNEINRYSNDNVYNKFKPNMRTIRSASYDPSINHKANRSTTSAYTNKSVLKPYKITGPDPLPARPIKYHLIDMLAKKALYEGLSYDNTDLYDDDEDKFDLNDFMLDNKYNRTLIGYCFDKVLVSTHNYEKICRLLAERIDEEKRVNTLSIQTLVPNVEPVENRKPLRQTMIEMASYLKNELQHKTGATLKTKFNPVTKWQKLNGAQTELIIYEDNTKPKDENSSSNEQVSPSQLAVVDSLLRNGIALSLKAHFIDKLPDISSLYKTLIYINLSFNNFKDIPEEFFEMPQLEAIKLRSNPIRYLPDRLSNLQNLKILSLAYCLLKEIPSCIFDLENLIHLDLSYNLLTFIDERIVNLNCMKTLNLEGNEIEYFPCCMLHLRNLEQINVKNNYLHPLIWRNCIVNEVQSLFNMCATKVCKYYREDSFAFTRKLSFKLQAILTSNFIRCDICGNKRFGDGIKLIRPCVKIFGVKYLPFLFHSCSVECYYSVKKKKVDNNENIELSESSLF